MKIAVVSDTHMTKLSCNFTDLIYHCFQEIDLIIHAGDYVTADVVEALKQHKPFVGVWGNVDDIKVRKSLEEKEVIEIENYRIGIFHGHGEGGTTFERAYEKFDDEEVDIIIFGHSHQPFMRTKNGILMLNPGSLTNKRRERWFSYIVLELTQGSINLQFNFF